MVFGWLNARVNPVAVDIGTDAIKMLQVEPKDNALRLVAAASTQIPEALREKPRERDEFATDAIKKMLGEGGFKGKQIVTCLPAAQMAVQHLRVGKMSPEELVKALPFEVQGKLPFDAGRAVLRHVVAGEVYQEQEAKTEVIVLAASRESVDRHLGILSKAKLDVVGIHVEPTALIECFGHLFRRKGDENISTLFVDIGAGNTHVVIAHGKHMVFAKHVQVGGDTFNRRVAEALKMPFVGACEARVRATSQMSGAHRLPAGVVAIGGGGAEGHPLGDATTKAGASGRDGGGGARMDGETLEKILSAIEEPLEILISDLELCVRYYESIFPGKQIDRVIFVGGESRHVGLCQKVAQRLGLPATLGDPMARLAKDSHANCALDLRLPQPGWAIAVGLAIGVTPE